MFPLQFLYLQDKLPTTKWGIKSPWNHSPSLPFLLPLSQLPYSCLNPKTDPLSFILWVLGLEQSHVPGSLLSLGKLLPIPQASGPAPPLVWSLPWCSGKLWNTVSSLRRLSSGASPTSPSTGILLPSRKRAPSPRAGGRLSLYLYYPAQAQAQSRGSVMSTD